MAVGLSIGQAESNYSLRHPDFAGLSRDDTPMITDILRKTRNFEIIRQPGILMQSPIKEVVGPA